MRFFTPTAGLVLAAILQITAPVANAQQSAPSPGSPAPGQTQMGPGMGGMDHMKCPDPKKCSDHMKGMDHSMMGQGMGQMTMPPSGQPQTDPPKDGATKHNHSHPQSN